MILRGIKFWATSNSQKLSVLAISEALNLDFDKFEHFFKSQIHKNSKLRVPEILKWPFLRFKFRINCSHVNLGGNWQLNSWIFHTVGLNFTFLKFLEHSVCAWSLIVSLMSYFVSWSSVRELCGTFKHLLWGIYGVVLLSSELLETQIGCKHLMCLHEMNSKYVF